MEDHGPRQRLGVMTLDEARGLLYLPTSTPSSDYYGGGRPGANLFAELRKIDGINVTGSAYSWMTDEARLAPGGNYVRVPDDHRGGLGGNRFFTLRVL